MAKKRKLNSKNPRYITETRKVGPKIKEKRLFCNVPVRNANGEIIEGKTIPVYGVWYEEDKKTNKKELYTIADNGQHLTGEEAVKYNLN